MFETLEAYYFKFLLFLDKVFILPYQLFYKLLKNSVLAYFLGTFLLALSSIMLGKLLLGVIYYVNRNYIKSLTEELVKWYNLSVEALERGDTERFHLFNNEANEYFGKLFFFSIAQSASLLIFIPFILFFLQFRFGEVEFPLPWLSLKANYFATFLLCYLLAWILFKRVSPLIPLYKKIDQYIEICNSVQREMKSMAEVLKRKMEALKEQSQDENKSLKKDESAL
ncbi:MAG: hypothetical protein ABWJ99_07175 [Caldimicrobium sp.]